MCGIVGIVSFDAPVDGSVLTRMSKTLVHRGPDDEGSSIDGPCALGFRRLSIIDLVGGHQPMRSGPLTVVFNGEIYNFRELRDTLSRLGHRFQTGSDTEVLLEAHLQWGDSFVEKLDGMFAFALWDRENRRLLLARDRFGKKPLYWMRRGGTLIFASELKAIVQHPLCERRLNPAAVRRYLAFEYVPTPDAIFEGVFKLDAAHTLSFDGHEVSSRRFWALPDGSSGWRAQARSLEPSTVATEVEQLRSLLAAAVQRRLVADVPVGIFLSGGVDSTAVAAFARKTAGDVATFSLAFEEGSFDESGFARTAADALGTHHHEERLPAARCLDLVPAAAEHLDEPFADPSYFPTYLLSRFARTKVTVALGGDGADELFAGYETFPVHHAAVWWSRFPAGVQRLARRLANLLPSDSSYMSLDFKVKTFLAGAAVPERYRHQTWIGSFDPRAQSQLLRPDWRAAGDSAADIYAPLDAFVRRSSERGLEQVLRSYIDTYMKDDILTKVDRASMAASLEVRSPFLDRDLVEHLARLPSSFKLHGLQRKWLLKRALKGFVPDAILRRRKHGFAIPVADWLRGPLRELLEDHLASADLRDTGIFEPSEVQRLLREHVEGRVDHRKPLWTLLMFELWRRRWTKRTSPS